MRSSPSSLPPRSESWRSTSTSPPRPWSSPIARASVRCFASMSFAIRCAGSRRHWAIQSSRRPPLGLSRRSPHLCVRAPSPTSRRWANPMTSSASRCARPRCPKERCSPRTLPGASPWWPFRLPGRQTNSAPAQRTLTTRAATAPVRPGTAPVRRRCSWASAAGRKSWSRPVRSDPSSHTTPRRWARCPRRWFTTR